MSLQILPCNYARQKTWQNCLLGLGRQPVHDSLRRNMIYQGEIHDTFDLSGKTAISPARHAVLARHCPAFCAAWCNVVVSSRKADACDEVTNSINEEYPGKR